MAYQRYFPWLTGALVVLAAWLAAQASWQVAALFREVPVPPSAEVRAVQRDAADPGYDVNNILSVPLFGVRSAETPAAEDIKHSRLKIRLLGVIAGERGVAILHHDGKEHTYAVGVRLDVRESVTLEAVRADHIVINRGGSREKIELEQDRQSRAAGKGVRVVNRGSRAVNLNTPEIRKLVGDPRQTLKQSPLRLMRFLNINPYNQDGRTVGFTVEPGRDKRLFPKLGLKAGDVVMSINNQPLGDVAVGDLLKSLDSNNTFELVVLRNGVPETIRLNL